MVVVPVLVVPHRLQYHSGGKLPVSRVPGMDKKTGLQFMKLQRPAECDGTICGHFESGVLRKVGCPWPTSAPFKSHCRTEITAIRLLEAGSQIRTFLLQKVNSTPLPNHTEHAGAQ